MKRKIFDTLWSILLFWVITDMLSGIVVQDGIVGYLICGGVFGIIMLSIIPLIRFFTLPIKFITIFLISVMLSIIIFFFLNFGVPFIDFTEGTFVGFANSYFTLPDIHLSMIGNVLTGGVISGLLYSLLKWLESECGLD
jgi:uncharacterized membrane protein YvlD (DUF360 family)